jgi:D-arginine dehydrogenase
LQSEDHEHELKGATMRECDFLIVGAGIAGTSCANWLSRDHSVIVVEMESQPGYHTTGRSIAVYTEAYGPRTVRALAKSGRDFFLTPPDGFTEVPLCRRQELMFVAREDQRPSLKTALAAVQELSPEIDEISPRETIARVPVMREDYLAAAFLDPTALGLDVDAIHQGYIRGLGRNGGAYVCDAGADRFERKGGKWQVTTRAGEFAAPVVINAAGAWADVIAGRVGAREIGLQPKRRTAIAFIPPGIELDNDWPVVIDTDDEFFFKVDAGTVMGSPADETPVPPQDAQPEDIDVAIAIDRLERATTMKVEKLLRKWAGLRSFVADDVPVVGYDPGVDGYFWCAGQGGYGIETSYGMGRVSAALAAGGALPDDIQALGVTEADLAPQRLWGDG